jgi:hypothetical protein
MKSEFCPGPGPGKGGTGVLSVDGKELAKTTVKHTIPLPMSIDETFDVGLDTRTGVDDSYSNHLDSAKIEPGLLLGTALIVFALGTGGAIGALGYSLPILGLSFAAFVGLSSRHAVLILLSHGSVARIRVGCCGSLTVTANGLATSVLDTIRRS